MMRLSPAPAALAASTNSFSRNERNSPRTMRAIPVQKRNARMRPITIGCGIVTVVTPRFTLTAPWPKNCGGDEQDREARQREDEVGEAHEAVVDRAAVVAGDGADEGADERREQRDDDRDAERRLDAVDDAAEVVAAELVGAEDVPVVQRRRPVQAVDEVVERDLVLAVWERCTPAKMAMSPKPMRMMRLVTASLCRKKRMRAYAHWLRASSSTPCSYVSSMSGRSDRRIGSSSSATLPVASPALAGRATLADDM